jgi:hypothetical protein
VFGLTIENDLAELKRGKHENEEFFARRRQQRFLSLLGEEQQMKFASPVATR